MTLVRRPSSLASLLALLFAVLLALPAATAHARGPVTAQASGGGQYLLAFGDAQLPGSLGFGAVQQADGTAHGHFRIDLDLQDQLGGGVASFRGEVTCLTVDDELGRAWIGGVVTANSSTNELFRDLPITQVGADVWFRVLDDGEGAGAVDRTTFAGFEGGAGIITSQEYCDVQPWPDDNARTHPVTAGNINVRG